MDLETIRKDTAGCTGKIFLNSAGSSLMPRSVVAEMNRYLAEEEQIGGYGLARERADDIGAFYSEVAKLINGKPDNIAFAFHATDAYAKALSAIPFTSGDSILTTNDDYISNQIAFLSLQKRFGIKILRADNLPNGDLDLDNFESLVKKHQPRLVAITHVPTNSGLIQAAEEVGNICKAHNTWYLLDACQSVGQLVVDVEKIGCDFLSVTGRKFLRGPRGTGFLYVSDRVIEEKLEPLFLDMRGADWVGVDEYQIRMDAIRFETWELSYALLLGLTEAVRYANNVGISEIQNCNQKLSQKLREGLSQIPGLRVLDRGSKLASIVTFTNAGVSLERMEKSLKEHDIIYSVSFKNFALIDFTNKGVEWVIRLSPHYFNTLDEIEQVTDVLAAGKG